MPPPTHQTLHERANAAAVRDAAQQTWDALLRAIEQLRINVRELPTPQDVYDQVYGLLRDDCKCGRWWGVCGGLFVVGTLKATINHAWNSNVPFERLKKSVYNCWPTFGLCFLLLTNANLINIAHPTRSVPQQCVLRVRRHRHRHAGRRLAGRLLVAPLSAARDEGDRLHAPTRTERKNNKWFFCIPLIR